MWRVLLSITAVVFNSGLILLSALGLLGFAVNAAGRQLGATDYLGLGFFIFLTAGAVISIVAIATGARLRARAKSSAAQVASEFS